MAKTRIAKVECPPSEFHGRVMAFFKENGMWTSVTEGVSFSENYLQFQDSHKGAAASQIGGTHYRDMRLQPIDFIMQNNLDFCTGNAIKYLCRHKAKNGKQDLEKAIHYIQMLMEQEYPNASTPE